MNNKRVLKILMERDGMSEEEAKQLIADTIEELLHADPWETDDILMDNLGLEPDYIFDLF